jgi:hypothetical protein
MKYVPTIGIQDIINNETEGNGEKNTQRIPHISTFLM